MPSSEHVELAVPSAPGNGIHRKVGTVFDKTVQVSGAFAGSIVLQGRIADGDFADLGAAITAPGFVQVVQAVNDMRVVTTAMTGPPPRVLVLGAF